MEKRRPRAVWRLKDKKDTRHKIYYHPYTKGGVEHHKYDPPFIVDDKYACANCETESAELFEINECHPWGEDGYLLLFCEDCLIDNIEHFGIKNPKKIVKTYKTTKRRKK